MYVCMYCCLVMNIYMYIYTHTHTYTYTCICFSIYVYIYIYRERDVYTYMYIYTYIYIYIHIYIYIYIRATTPFRSAKSSTDSLEGTRLTEKLGLLNSTMSAFDALVMGEIVIPPSLHNQCGKIPEVQIKTASDYTWFPLHPPVGNVEPPRPRSRASPRRSGPTPCSSPRKRTSKGI